MADVKEKDLSAKTTLGTSDYLRVVGSDNASYKQLVSDVAKCIVENYTGSTIAGSAQSIKSALDNLNSKLKTKHISGTFSNGQIELGLSQANVPLGMYNITRTGWQTLFIYRGNGVWVAQFGISSLATGEAAFDLIYY